MGSLLKKLLLAAGSIIAKLGGGEVSDAGGSGEGRGLPHNVGGVSEDEGHAHNLGGLDEGVGHTPTTTAGGLSIWTFTGPRGAVVESFQGVSSELGGLSVNLGHAHNVGGLGV